MNETELGPNRPTHTLTSDNIAKVMKWGKESLFNRFADTPR